jgi:Secretion system C-terminal sorting domain
MNPLATFPVKDYNMKLLRYFLLVGVMAFSFVGMAQDITEPSNADLSKQVKIYPNPAIEFLSIKFETPQARKANLDLRNIIGNHLDTESEIVDDYEIKVKVKDLPTGLYLVLIKNDETGLKGAYKFLKK